MAVANPNLAVATRIATLATWTLGTNVLANGRKPPGPGGLLPPIKCVFCLAVGGPAPLRTFGTTKLGRPQVQVRMRWDAKEDTASAEAAMRAIINVLDSSDLGAGYLNCFVNQSEATPMGIGPDGWPEWMIIAEAMFQP